MANGLPPEFELPPSRNMSPSTVEGLLSGLGMGGFNLLAQPGSFKGGVGKADLEYQEERRQLEAKRARERARRERGEQLPPAEVGPPPDLLESPPEGGPGDTIEQTRSRANLRLGSFKDGPHLAVLQHFGIAEGMNYGGVADAVWEAMRRQGEGEIDITGSQLATLRKYLASQSMATMNTDDEWFQPETSYMSNLKAGPPEGLQSANPFALIGGIAREYQKGRVIEGGGLPKGETGGWLQGGGGRHAQDQEKLNLLNYIMGGFNRDLGPLGEPIGYTGGREMPGQAFRNWDWGRSPEDVIERFNRMRTRSTPAQNPGQLQKLQDAGLYDY